eukprot:7340110-Prymnesium_polylepis.1
MANASPRANTNDQNMFPTPLTHGAVVPQGCSEGMGTSARSPQSRHDTRRAGRWRLAPPSR